MPAPLAIPRTTKGRPPISARAWTTLGPRSVVRIASAKRSAPWADSELISEGTAAMTLALGNVTPMTPVEAGRTPVLGRAQRGGDRRGGVVGGGQTSGSGASVGASAVGQNGPCFALGDPLRRDQHRSRAHQVGGEHGRGRDRFVGDRESRIRPAVGLDARSNAREGKAGDDGGRVLGANGHAYLPAF